VGRSLTPVPHSGRRGSSLGAPTGSRDAALAAGGRTEEVANIEVAAAALTLRIGQDVTYQGRTYRLCGLQPMSVPDREAELQDAASGERFWVPLEALDQQAGDPEPRQPGEGNRL
jgi:hypothetical protein